MDSMKAAGATLSDLKAAGFSAKDLQAGGYNARELRRSALPFSHPSLALLSPFSYPDPHAALTLPSPCPLPSLSLLSSCPLVTVMCLSFLFFRYCSCLIIFKSLSLVTVVCIISPSLSLQSNYPDPNPPLNLLSILTLLYRSSYAGSSPSSTALLALDPHPPPPQSAVILRTSFTLTELTAAGFGASELKIAGYHASDSKEGTYALYAHTVRTQCMHALYRAERAC